MTMTKKCQNKLTHKHYDKKEYPRLQDPITPPGVYVHTENDILDFAVIITEHLLDKCPGYLATEFLSKTVSTQSTPLTFKTLLKKL